mgnify:CR=1 FL=1
MSEPIDHKKEYAKLKRVISEVAGEIHDIVEDTLWDDHHKLAPLGEKVSLLITEAQTYKKEHGL